MALQELWQLVPMYYRRPCDHYFWWWWWCCQRAMPTYHDRYRLLRQHYRLIVSDIGLLCVKWVFCIVWRKTSNVNMTCRYHICSIWSCYIVKFAKWWIRVVVTVVIVTNTWVCGIQIFTCHQCMLLDLKLLHRQLWQVIWYQIIAPTCTGNMQFHNNTIGNDATEVR